jgi:hypothetical protein
MELDNGRREGTPPIVSHFQARYSETRGIVGEHNLRIKAVNNNKKFTATLGVEQFKYKNEP